MERDEPGKMSWFNQRQVSTDLRSERCSREFPDRQSQEQLHVEGTADPTVHEHQIRIW